VNPDIYADLETLYKATWDASWGANNQEEVYEAYKNLLAFLDRHQEDRYEEQEEG
jgi:hypothetical protein